MAAISCGAVGKIFLVLAALSHVCGLLAPRQRLALRLQGVSLRLAAAKDDSAKKEEGDDPAPPLVNGVVADGEGLSGEMVLDGPGGEQLSVDLRAELGDSFMAYAMSIILGRALPDARDGLKPVHRRILYAMHGLGLQPEAQHRKCARVVGEVLGKYHPHGDGAVYEALVRMAQDWVMSARLVDGHGNFGSLDADPPAAMRYTECRLTPLARDTLLADIGAATVDFLPNFDGSENEPVVLPSRLPLLLLNGASGIAVGMATNAPPHNLGELVAALTALARDPSLPDEELFDIVPAPDFPTGGFVLGTDGARDLYRTGKGSIGMRAKTHVETLRSRGGVRSAIVVSELPYMVNKSLFLSRTAALVNDKKLDGVSDLRDESDRDGMRIVIELKRDAVAAVVQNNLFKRTQLQSTFSGNLLALAEQGKQPLRLGLRAALDEFIGFRFTTVRRRTAHELGKLEARDHIVQGLRVALERIDDVIDMLRKAKDAAAAKKGLTKDLGLDLSAEQVDAILNLRLARLTALETKKLDSEHKTLLKGIKKLKHLMEDDAAVTDVMVEEWEELGRRHSVPRRSQILEDPNATMDLTEEDLLANDRSVVVLTQAGYIKRMPVSEFHAQGRGTRGKAGARQSGLAEDAVTQFFTCNDHDTVLFITAQGIAHGVRAFQVPLASRTARGSPLPAVLPLGAEDRVTGVVPVTASDLADDTQFLVLITRRGWIKKTSLPAFASLNARGLIVLGLEDGDQLLQVRRCTNEDTVVVATRRGFATRFAADQAQLRATGRTSRGVKGIKLREDDEIVDLEILPPKEDANAALLLMTRNGFGKRLRTEELRTQNRGGMGATAIKFKKPGPGESPDSLACCRLVAAGHEVMMTTAKGTIVRQRSDAISAQSRTATGVRVQKLDESDAILEVAVVPEETLEADIEAAAPKAGASLVPQA